MPEIAGNYINLAHSKKSGYDLVLFYLEVL